LLVVDNLSIRFPIRSGLLRRITGHVNAVDGVSFSVDKGQTLALVGESGCGKTTTGKGILQLLGHVAQLAGSVKLDGQELMGAHASSMLRARQQLQIVFQDPYGSLNPRMRVGEILEEGLVALRADVAVSERRTRVAALMEQVGLPRAAMEKYPHEFSGGQRQRIAIARALAVEPKIIICDEPTSALDVSVQAQILNLLRSLQQELGVAYLFITHNISVVEYLAQKIAVMRNGRIVEAGPCTEVLRNPTHDYTRELLNAVPRVI